MSMNKTQITKELKELLDNTLSIIPKTKHEEVIELFSTMQAKYEPKSGGGQTKFPAYEEEGIIYHYCRYTQEYWPQDEMVMSSGKSKGYSKVAISRWTKLGKEAKTLKDEALKCLLNSEVELGQELNTKSEELLVNRNKPETYIDLKKEA